MDLNSFIFIKCSALNGIKRIYSCTLLWLVIVLKIHFRKKLPVSITVACYKGGGGGTKQSGNTPCPTLCFMKACSSAFFQAVGQLYLT